MPKKSTSLLLHLDIRVRENTSSQVTGGWWDPKVTTKLERNPVQWNRWDHPSEESLGAPAPSNR